MQHIRIYLLLTQNNMYVVEISHTCVCYKSEKSKV